MSTKNDSAPLCVLGVRYPVAWPHEALDWIGSLLRVGSRRRKAVGSVHISALHLGFGYG